MKPYLEFHPEGGWTTFHTAGLLVYDPGLLYDAGLVYDPELALLFHELEVSFLRGNPLIIPSLPPPPKLP
jgi:hypothetical protein